MLAAAAAGPAPGASEQRFSVLTWEQVQRLDQILGEAVPIHGRGNFPTLSVRPRTIVQVRPGGGRSGTRRVVWAGVQAGPRHLVGLCPTPAGVREKIKLLRRR